MSHVVLVADPGGHLALLAWLRTELGPRRVTWVSLDQRDVRGRVGHDAVIFGVGPTARSPRALVQNLRQAARVLPDLEADLVLSSGAALGVPWLWVASARGVPTAFLEVADRPGASLSQRLVRPWVDHLLVQRAPMTGAVHLGRLQPPAAAPQDRTGPIFVALGTAPHPFERLVRAAEELAARGHAVWVQHGSSRAPRGCRTTAMLTPRAFHDALGSARVVVCHGGLAIQAEAAALGRSPLVVPRRAHHGEHVDDHQWEACAGQSLVVDPVELASVVEDWVEPVAQPASDVAARARFRRWLDQACPSM